MVAPPQLPPIPIARRPFEPAQPFHHLGFLNIVRNQCPSCKALHWLDERLSDSSKIRPKFGMCCYNGKISLPSLPQPPPELYWLLTTEDPRGRSFRDHIRNYNAALAMTSVGRQLDNTLNNGGGPWIFKLHGELSHRIGSLLPPPDHTPCYAQLYIYDSEQALRYRTDNPHNSELDHATLLEL